MFRHVSFIILGNEFCITSRCSSPVGYWRRRNTINLARGCWNKGIVIHEIMHSLGFYHEQSRPDRDNFVNINWNNIRKSKWKP